jgi:hypothetical protein
MQIIKFDFIDPKVYFYFGDDIFWVRWTLIAFMIAFGFVFLLFYPYFDENCMNYLKFIRKKTREEKKLLCLTVKNFLGKHWVSLLIYSSTVIVYWFSKLIVKDESTIIYKLAETANNLEGIVIIGLFVFLIIGLKYKNKNTYYNFLMKVISVIEIVYIFAYYLTDQVELTQWFNWGGVIIFGILFIILATFKIDVADTGDNDENDYTYIPVEKYEQLYEKRKWQADGIASIIEDEIADSGCTICISGGWGTGKTSLMNGIIEQVKERKVKKIEVIKINAMELDDKATLINYVFKCIARIIKNNAIYTGIASEYRELISSFAGTLVNGGVGNFIAQKLNGSSDDYRDNIDALNEVIHRQLKDTRIIIVVDDLERCSDFKAREFLFIMKEVATLNNCITIFLMDYAKMESHKNLGEGFLDKFFNYKFSLSAIGYEEIIGLATKDKPTKDIIRQTVEDIRKKSKCPMRKIQISRRHQIIKK